MKNYGVNELRKMYLEFFESKEHVRANSFSLVPKNDKSLLLINSGMAPLKPYFTGQEIPPSKRMTTCQKCIRTGDIENVGKTARHGTFFEMLGNFSFGDYFKKEAIAWAWEFFTEVLAIPKDMLYVSVYEDDDEAEAIWHNQEKVPMERIIRMGKADNFWEHGLGPCGPCSEIYVDRGEKYKCDAEECTVGCECDRYVEIWNLVFTQYEKMENGDYIPLKNPNIDTGMGLERLAMMMQRVDSFFDVDTMKVIRDTVCQKANVTYLEDVKKDVSIRVITDHIRSVTFMTSDGILPSNEGRGYVLRRLLRRAARHGKLLGIQGGFLKELASIVIESSKDGYPELKEKEAYILKVLTTEEERFAETIDQGIEILNMYLDELGEEKTLSGEKAFKLYDTYGFPLDLTIEIAEEQGVCVDEDGFSVEMNKQRERARNARETSNYMGAKETVYNQLEIGIGCDFNGYVMLDSESVITALTVKETIVDHVDAGDKVSVFVRETPFYGTSGGQQADIGYIETETGKICVEDVIHVVGNNIAHIGHVVEGYLEVGQKGHLTVDVQHRMATAKNHSATHLLQKALKTVLGDHVEQAGSSVSADRLRFDFTHFEGISQEDLNAVENIVNAQIQKGLNVHVEEMSIAAAKERGAMALFGEKYGDVVRVVDMDNYSVELCGGTHLSNVSEIGLFKIVSEGGVAAGVRRIEALTGQGAIQYYQRIEKTLNNIAGIVRCDLGQVEPKVQTLMDELKVLKRENEQMKSKAASSIVDELLQQKITIGDIELLSVAVDGFDNNRLRDLGDKLQARLTQGVVVLASTINDKVLLSVMASEPAVNKGVHAGKVISAIAKTVGGGGGGKPNIAQAGGKDVTKINDALTQGIQFVQEQLQG